MTPTQSEQLLRLLVDRVEDYALFVLTPEGNVASWNPGAARIKGYKAEEIVGSHFSRFYPREDVEAGKCEMELREAARVGRFEDEGWRVRKDGSQFWANVVITALRDDSGRLVGFAKVTRDLTARRQREEDARRLAEARAAQEAAETLQAIGTAFAGALTRSDVANVIAAQVLPAVGATGGSLRIRVPPSDVLQLAWTSGEAEGEAIEIPLVAGGEALGVLELTRSSTRPFSDVERALTSTLANQCALALDRVLTFEREQNAVRARDDFMSIAGHELRTPLAAMLLNLQTIQRLTAKLDESDGARVVRERIAKAENNAARLGRLIADLLDVARLTARRLEFELEELDMDELVREVLSDMADLASRTGSEVRYESAGPVRGSWDRFRIEQVVGNLVTNALKYGLGKPVTVRVRTAGEVVVLEVEDSGIGIEPAQLGRIFERFERAVSDRHFGGLGLGLWISRQIVDASGGTIEVESTPGVGSLFRMRLPLHAKDIAHDG